MKNHEMWANIIEICRWYDCSLHSAWNSAVQYQPFSAGIVSQTVVDESSVWTWYFSWNSMIERHNMNFCVSILFIGNFSVTNLIQNTLVRMASVQKRSGYWNEHTGSVVCWWLMMMITITTTGQTNPVAMWTSSPIHEFDQDKISFWLTGLF